MILQAYTLMGREGDEEGGEGLATDRTGEHFKAPTWLPRSASHTLLEASDCHSAPLLSVLSVCLQTQTVIF